VPLGPVAVGAVDTPAVAVAAESLSAKVVPEVDVEADVRPALSGDELSWYWIC
jgi:hypothetical protein